MEKVGKRESEKKKRIWDREEGRGRSRERDNKWNRKSVQGKLGGNRRSNERIMG